MTLIERRLWGVVFFCGRLIEEGTTSLNPIARTSLFRKPGSGE